MMQSENIQASKTKISRFTLKMSNQFEPGDIPSLGPDDYNLKVIQLIPRAIKNPSTFRITKRRNASHAGQGLRRSPISAQSAPYFTASLRWFGNTRCASELSKSLRALVS